MRKTTEKEKDDMVMMYLDGMTTYQIGEELERHRLTVANVLKEAGIKMRGTGKGKSKLNHIKDDMIKMWNDGVRVEVISDTFGVDKQIIRTMLCTWRNEGCDVSRRYRQGCKLEHEYAQLKKKIILYGEPK